MLQAAHRQVGQMCYFIIFRCMNSSVYSPYTVIPDICANYRYFWRKIEIYAFHRLNFCSS